MKKYIPGIILTLFLGLFGVFNADTMALDSDYKNKNSLVQSPDLIKSTRFSKILIGIGAQHIAEEVEEFLVNKYQIDTKSIIIV